MRQVTDHGYHLGDGEHILHGGVHGDLTGGPFGILIKYAITTLGSDMFIRIE